MSTHTFRITVRGFFDALTDAQRDKLLAEADQHDILATTYTTEGQLSYDLPLRDAFAFRFLMSGEEKGHVTQATKQAQTAAATWLTERGYAFKKLRSHAVDLAYAPLSKRQRQAATRG